MATAEILPPNRSHIGDLLLGDQLSTKFHELFDSKEEFQKKKNDKKKPKKKPKTKNKDKKHKRDKSPEPTEVLLPTVELAGNPSLFNVYASVRQTVLEQCMKDAVTVYQNAANLQVSDTDTEEEPEDKNREPLIRIPKIVGIGLNGVFELIRETCHSYPALCVKALQALLDLLQGQQPESMKSEPADIIESMYHLLIEIAKGHSPNSSHGDHGRSLTSLACAALLSLVIARGDTGKLLTAVAAMLMSPTVLATQHIQVPYILTSLQKSIQAILLGRTQLPDWLTCGVREKSLRHTFKLHDLPSDISTTCAVASDGDYLFIHNRAGLYKVGTGYGGTVKGHVYAVNSRFYPGAKGWLAFAAGKIYFKDLSNPSGELSVVCLDSLDVISTTELEGGVSSSNVLFSDGEHIGQVAAAKDDSFVVRTYNADVQPMTVSSEVPLKLARKCVDTFGSSPIDDQVDIHSISTGFDEDTSSIAAGKEFALIKTVSGKVLYSGKSQSLGIKQGGPSQGKWAELSITKSPKITQISIGHEGQHALLVAEDGGVFFVGTPKRGEDGDSSVLKARRQPKPLKPKKMIKLETKFIVQAACNNGTSSVVTKEGEVFMYGKDTSHCDHASGHVSDLKDVMVTQVALGKAHAVALTNKGRVYTYGINNKGQCGRDYTPGAGREANTIVNMVEEEEENEVADMLCPPGKHKWKTSQCMICTVCGECTGYGSRCINSGSSDRNPGLPCMCGAGDSGCSECGCCKMCAGEQVEDRELIDQLYKSKDLNFLDLVLSGRPGAQQLDQLSKKLEQKKKTARFKVFLNSIRPSKSVRGNEPVDAEPEYSKLTSLPPSEIMVGNGDTPVSQIACGLHHSVLLLHDGSVYTFGSNQYGQLGLGDTVIRGVPTRVSLPSPAVQLAAGSNHTVILLANGQVLTCGNFQKGSLGRLGQEEPSNNLGAREKTATWFTVPGPVPGIGAKFGRRATWIGASGDQTFLRVDESLINAHTLAKSNVFANQSGIGLIPTGEDGGYTIRCLVINKIDGSCKSFSGPDQVDLANHATCLDPVYDVLWSYCPNSHEVSCYNVISSEAVSLKAVDSTYCDLFEPELAVPVRHGSKATRSHSAIHVLACLDTHTTAQQLNMAVYEEEREKQITAKVFSKEDFLVVNRFESHGGGWGYSGHSIEAIRFMTDSDILLGGFGLFGGRGEYYGRIKIFDLGPDGGENETDGELLAETEEMPYECGAREKYAMLFDEPVSLQANTWYVAWARISGPSSDCGSSGQSTVTTEDQSSELSKFKVVFKFKSSKKSNNGTDVNAGQIPQILYRLPTHDSQSSVRKSDQTEPAHILSTEFSRAVSPTCFESLLMLLRWSWKTFSSAVIDVGELKGIHKKAGVSDLERLVYISTATLRLLRIYVTEVYPGGGSTVKAPTETVKLAECVGNTRDLLREILSEGPSQPMFRVFLSQPPATANHLYLQENILNECHRTFTACFHAFYPTESLKWMCLCDLLNLMEPGVSDMDGYGRLLAAIMEAMCHPSVKLTNIFPINCEHETEEILRRQSVSIDDNTNSAARLGDVHQYPLLVSHMLYRTGTDSSTMAHCSFKEILDRLLTIVTLPIRQALLGESPMFPSLLVANTCSLLATIVSELSSSALGSETDTVTTTRPLLTTPNRFTRTSQSAYWNTGNGSPDAVAFTVDRPGVVVAGVCVYGGGGQYDYELELLDECESQGEASHSQRWNSLELVKGTYGVDSVNDVAEVKFDRPVPVKENVKYAIRLRNHGPRTLNGDGGLSKVKCSDGATFTFSACSLSINGTNHMRGQMPHILYYSAPQDGENHVQNNKALAEQQSRKNGISIVSAICRAAKDILQRAQGHLDEDIGSIVGKSHLFSSLLPLVLAYIGPVAAQDPRGAVQVLALVQDVLPAVAALNSQLTPHIQNPTTGPANANEANQSGDFTTSQHFAIVESDHPYKPATVANYKVSFPDSVKWVVLEFDPQCGTAQAEDTLQLYVPSVMRHQLVRSKPPPNSDKEESQHRPSHWPILKKFSGTHNWPKQSVILPGNEVIFSLETASDYVKDDKACFHGFKCFVVGYEWTFGQSEGIQHLEKELSYLGGMCASSLMRQDIALPPATVEEFDDDIDQTEEGAQMVFNAHSNLLSQGFALSHPPTIGQALEGNLPFCWQSNERAFLKDFVACTAGTSGGRLARWLQPDSYLDPKQCDILYNKDDLKCSWPVVITVQTKDQYGQLVNVPNLKVDVKAVPIDQKDSGDDNKKMRRLSRPDDGDLTFGGHPPPHIDIPYEVTLKDKKDAFHAISMMKAYENYSFEELRYAAPSLPRPSENMLVRANNDGTYSANWTPGSIGLYNVYVSIDGFEAGEVYKVEVKEPPQGMTPPTMANKKLHQTNRMRRFVGKHSAGLRIRSNPSLQSEQIGIIPPGGILGYVDEVHNDDGVWLRLNPESIAKWCDNGYSEGWALQYNQHLGKTLLVPVEEPKSILDEIIKDAIHRKLPDIVRENSKSKKGGPGVYHLVRCGSSGHNIRCGPSRKARPIGMLVLGNTVTATQDLVNADGAWVKLDMETTEHYCHEVEGEAWSLARGPDEVVYLQHESELSTSPDLPKGSPFSMNAFPGGAASPSQKGYDFTTAQRSPSFSVFGPSIEGTLPSVPSFGDHTGASGPTFAFTSPGHMSGIDYLSHKLSRGSEGSITPLRKPNHPKSPIRAATMGSYSPVPEKIFERKDIPPELQGVSVKELVKALGESRANANGPTPAPSPPGTPKKSLSRSSSPKAEIDLSKRMSPGRPASPQRSDSPGSKSMSQRSDSPCGSTSSKSDSPGRIASHRSDSPGRSFHQRPDSPCRGNAPPRPERTDKLVRPDRPDRPVNANFTNRQNRPDRSNTNLPDRPDRSIMNNFERLDRPDRPDANRVDRLERPDRPDANRVDRLGVNKIEMRVIHRVEKPDLPPRNFNMKAERPDESEWQANHHPRPDSEVMITNFIDPPGYDSPPVGSPNVGRAKGKLTREMSFETPPATPPQSRKDISGEASPSSPRNLSPARMSPARGASGGHTPVSARSQSPSAGSSHSSSGGDSAVRPAFNIGTSSPKEEALRMSPKSSRKDRGRQLRSKRERAASPSPRDITPLGRARSASLLVERGREPVKEALSPSVAECLRAVFAAFLWHEGIVHDAMACASFLKFNSNLSKEMSKFARVKSEERDRVRIRHPTDSTHDRGKDAKKVDNINININEGLVSLRSDQIRDNNEANDKATGRALSSMTSDPSLVHRPRTAVKFQDVLSLEPLVDKGLASIDKESQLPPTLHHLVYFWEELSSAILKVVNQDLIIPSPAVNVKAKKGDKKEKDKDKEKKSKKRRDLKPMARGNLFGEAAGGIMFGHIGGGGAAGASGGDRETMCELCGGMFPHPVTYHMRQSHPGCGRHACGKGYNSGGNFCGGWAGNCGEGGIGGSSWYLMCDKCRDNYLREKKQCQKEKDRSKKQKKKNLPKQTSMVTTVEAHIVLKNNAMYLLELASAAGISLPVQSHKKRQSMPRSDMLLPSVSEDGGTELNPFPPKQFEFLLLRGAESSDSAFADEIFVDQEERVFVRSGSLSSGSPRRGGYRPRLPTEPHNHGALARASSLGQELKPVVRITPLSPQDIPKPNVVETGRPIPKSAGTSPDNEHDQGRRSIFQRSISELAENEVNEPNTSNRVIMTRRRNNSGGVGDGGTSLLKYPSAAMSKLIGSVDKTSGSSGMGDKALQRPVLAFIIQRHDLDGLQLAMRQALRKSACRVYAMQALNWLIRTVTQPTCLHDLLWFFVSSLLPCGEEEEEEEDNKEKKEKKDVEDKDIRVCEHPLSDITLAGKAAHPLQPTFHTMLQTIADVMMVLPAGSSLQQMAVRCYCLKFQQSDHQFLHESHVFSNISRILTKSDEESDEALETYWMTGKVICLKDLTTTADVKASSRQAMVASLSDNSTETFWESGDEDRNKTKMITITCTQRTHPRMVYVHIDNSRDLGNKVSSVQFLAGTSLDELKKYRQVEIEARHIGWVSCPIPDKNYRYLRLELKGPDNNLRLRQVKVLGEQEGESLYLPVHKGALLMQQNNCEAETLKVFRLLTSQVFGKLLSNGFFDGEEKRGDNLEGPGIDNDLKEHMVGILFSRSKLSHLQKQVCAHIVQAIRKETERVKEEWESAFTNKNKTMEEDNRVSDVYCFELLSMVLALSGSGVGRTHLAQQYGLLQDLFTLLHTGTPRVQRQVVSVLRRVLPEVLPEILATILKVNSLPPADFSIVTATSRDQGEEMFDPDKVGIIDVFLACIAKSLTVQTKIKSSGSNKGVTSVLLAESLSELPSISLNGARWWLRGNMSGTLATNIIQLLQDMAASQLSEPWAAITKAAIAEAILALTKLNEAQRVPQTCIRTPTLWLALASLCVLDREHVDRLSSGQWVSSQDGQHGQPRPTCDNHDDGSTAAIILCNDCGNLCADCDRFLHLHRKKRSHQRQVFKEEEEAIKVDLHEGCGRTKLFWVMALADSKTLKAMVEFREGKVTNTPGGPGTCRFCGTSSNTGLLAIGNVCADPECQESGRNACAKIHPCGHPCGGIKNEEPCLPCLHRCRGADQEQLKQDADDMCMICFTEALSAAPAVKLHCGHVFHCRCCQRVLEKKWVGPRITFGFSQCPICKSPINHSVLKDLLDPIRQLYEDVRRKALMRLEYEGLHKAEAITTPGARFHSDPAGFAMDRYAYYVCYKCKKAYYGGEARCDEQAGGGDEYDPTELVCGACSDVSRAQMCPKHGTDFLEYKCRYCCSVAVFFCFGTTHFCNACHDDFQRVTNIPKHELPHCPAGPRGKQLEGDECPLHVQHPPTGEEFALGCGVCRNAHTF